MKTLLKELWLGNIDPQTKTFDEGSEYGKMMHLLGENEGELMSSLSKEQAELFEKCLDFHERLNEIHNEDAFVSGFRLGVRLIIESLSEEKPEK